MYFLGWAAGRVAGSPADPLFLQRCAHHSICGEQHALLWAAVWAMQSPPHACLRLFSDCLIALNQAMGTYGWTDDTDFALLCRAALQALSTVRPTLDPCIHHVRSHQGHPANELADSLAKHYAKFPRDDHHPHQDWVAHRIRDGALPWLWMQFETVLCPTLWPQQVGHCIVDTHRHSDTAPLTVAECRRAVGLPPQDTSGNGQRSVCLSLCLLTVNVQSLSDVTETDIPQDSSVGFVGRARYLREQLTAQGLHVTALQEARATEDATYTSETHVRFCTSRDCKGNFGCELWFSRTIPFLLTDQVTGKFHPKDFLTLAASPRELIVRFSRSGIHILFICVHAPVFGAPDRESWWQSLRARIKKFCKDAHVVLLGDYNVGFASPILGRVGDLVWPTKHTVPQGLAGILQDHDLWLPSTFGQCHTGQSETWVSPNGSTGARLDYIALPATWGVAAADSWVDTALDWGQPRVDHFGHSVRTFFVSRIVQEGKSRGCMLDREAMATPEGQQLLNRICQNVPLQPWSSNVHRHYLAVEDYLRQSLSVAFPSRRVTCRSSHFSAGTWDIRQRRVWLRKQLAFERVALGLIEARAAVYSLRRQVPLYVGRVLALLPVANNFRRFQGLVQEIQTTRKQLRQAIRADNLRRVAETAAVAASIPKADVVSRLRPLLGPSKRRVKQRQSLQSVCHPDGTPAATAQEAETLWIQHFAGIEDGKRVEPVEFVRRVQQLQQDKDLDLYTLAATDLPSRVELEQSLRKTQMGRAKGLDGVPGELLHLAAATVSKSLYQLFLKASLRAAEPLAFKGGSLHAVWKGKSNPAYCSAHRGILVSSVIGKAFHRLVRDRAMPALGEVTTDMQIGGLPHYPVILASHFVRVFQTGSRDRQQSHGLLFLDLREAFYRVVRPLLTGTACHDEDIATALRAVSLPAGVMHELHAHLQDCSLAREAGATDWADYGITEALSGTWFRFQGGDQVVQTGIGSRPGDNLADICFSFIFAKVLQAIQSELRDKGILPHVPWSPAMDGNIFPVHAPVVASRSVLDSTWMDDSTFLITAPRASDLPEALKATGKAVIDSCVARALLPNLDKGKTEFVASPIGAGSRSVRKELFALPEPVIPLHCRLWESAAIRLVPTYQHLGGFIHHDSTLVRELRHRSALAWKAFNARRRKVFGAPNVAHKDKTILFESLILSILMHGAGTWDTLAPPEVAVLESTYHGMCFFHATSHILV